MHIYIFKNKMLYLYLPRYSKFLTPSLMIDMFDLLSFITSPSSKLHSYVLVFQASSFFKIKHEHGRPYVFLSVHPYFELSELVLSAYLTSQKIKSNAARGMLPANFE